MPDRSLRAAAVSGAELLTRQVLQFAVVAILARMLTPSDFGMVALAMVVITVLSSVADLGARIVIIRDPELDGRTVATAYWLVGSAAGALTVLTFALAPLVQRVSGVDGLTSNIRALAPVIILNAVGGLSMALLIRALRFEAMVAISSTATIAAGAVAIALAAQGAGSSALVVMAIVSGLVMAVASTWAARPPLLGRPSARRVRAVVGFGRYIVATMILDTVSARVPLLLVGTQFGVAAAGQYSRADNAGQSLKEATDSVLGRVALPILSRSAHDDDAFVAGVRTGFRFGMGTIGPAMIFVAAVGTPLTLALFGPQWEVSGPILTALAVGIAVWPVNVVAINALLARGRARTVFLVDLTNKLILVACAAAASLLGPLAIAWSVTAATVVAAVLNMRALRAEVPYAFTRQLGDVVPMVAVAAPWAVAAYWVAQTWGASPLLVAPLLLAVGAAATLLTAHLLRLSVLAEIRGRLRPAVGRR